MKIPGLLPKCAINFVVIFVNFTFALKTDENPPGHGQGNGNNVPSEIQLLPPLVECDGIFQKGKLSTELNLTIRGNKREGLAHKGDVDAFEVCTHVEIVITDATLVNWTEINSLQIKISQLNFFFLDLVIPSETNLTAAEYVGIVGWKNFLFFGNWIKKPETAAAAADIWTSGVGFGISVTGERILFYDPLPGHNQMFLMIGPYIDADDVVSGFNPFLRLRSLSLFNCKINNLATILSGELTRLEIVNVDYPSFEGFIKRCKSLEHLILRMKAEKFDFPASLTSKQIEKIEIENVTLTSSRKVTELDKLEALSSVRFQNCTFDKSFKEYRAWTIFTGLRHLQLSFISDTFDLNDLSLLPCKELSSLYISDSNLTCTKKSEAATAKNPLPLPLESLYFKNCSFDSSVVKNIWELFSDVKNLAVVSNLGSSLKPNPEFLEKVLNKVPSIKWVHFTNFNWSASQQEVGKKMASFLQQTKGELKGNEENFVLRRVEGRKWLGWKYISRKDYDEWELDQLMNSETPPEPYATARLEITTTKTEIQSYSEWSDYFWKLDREMLSFILSDDQPLSINESWSAERNMSIVVDGFIVLNVGHGDENEKEISIARLSTASKILRSIQGNGNLTKLALLQVGIEEFGLLQCEHLQKLFIRSVSFEERDVNTSTIATECGELTELILFPASPYDSDILEIDLRTGLKSKKLQKLVINSANISLTIPVSAMISTPAPVYETLEDFYLDSVDLQPSFLENCWKFYPNIKRIGIGYTRTGLPNPVFLKSILENLKHVERIYFYNFEWSSSNPEANSEMERFVFSTKGNLFGNETHFGLEKTPGGNGKWIGKEFDASHYEHQFLEFEVLRMDYFFTDYSKYVERVVLI